MIVMQVVAGPMGETLPVSGQYLESFDFEAFEGQGFACFTPDPAKAMRFADAAELLEFYKRSPVCRPFRDDGQPNRPVTATTWQLVQIDEPAGRDDASA